MAATPGESCFGHSNALQLPFTVGTGAKRLLIVVVTATANYTNNPFVTVEWGKGAQSLTEFSTTPGNPGIDAFYLFAPNSGTDTIYVNSSNIILDGAVASSFAGVAQVTPAVANLAPAQGNTSGTGTTAAVTVSVANTNDLMVSALASSNSGAPPTNTYTGATQQTDTLIVRSGSGCSVSSWEAVSLGARPALGTADWTITAANLGWSAMAFDVRGIAAPTPPPVGGGPGPSFTPLPGVVLYPELLNLNCNVVVFSDPRGDIAVSSTVLWVYNFGDGSPLDYSPVPNVGHKYAVAGVYDATMTTQDKQGNVQMYSIPVDTTLAGCVGAVIKGVAPITFTGLFVAFLVASFVAGKKHPKWKHRLRVAGVVSLVIVVGVVVLL